VDNTTTMGCNTRKTNKQTNNGVGNKFSAAILNYHSEERNIIDETELKVLFV
jgi:hypothetical protein